MNTPTEAGIQTAAQLYKKYAADREQTLKRARACAEVTIPALMPPEGHTQQQDLKTPWQSVGARGVNNLAAKLLLALFPAEVSFFKITPTAEVQRELEAAELPKGEMQAALSNVEQRALEDMEASGDRAALFETLKQLINSGNALLHNPTDGKPARIYRLDRYVVKRDLTGAWIDCIVEEGVYYDELPKDVQELIALEPECVGAWKAQKPIMIYTRIHRVDTQYKVYQEIAGHRIPNSEGSFPLDLCPWLPLRMIAVPGEDYGRSYVEEYLGDLDSLELLQQALVEGTVGAARFFLLVNPTGSTKKDAVEKARNGDVINGNAEDITTYRAEKANDLAVGKSLAQELETRLEFAFLMNTAIQRNAERVTAEEIRYMAEELDSTLGGVYTVLSQELQLPYVRLRIHRLQTSGALPRWPKKALRLSISTGLDAIGRGRDVNRLRTFVSIMRETFGEQVVAQVLDVTDFGNRLAAGIGLDAKGLVKTQEQVSQEQTENQNTQTMQQLAPDVIRAGGNLAAAAMKQQTQQPTE